MPTPTPCLGFDSATGDAECREPAEDVGLATDEPVPGIPDGYLMDVLDE